MLLTHKKPNGAKFRTHVCVCEKNELLIISIGFNRAESRGAGRAYGEGRSRPRAWDEVEGLSRRRGGEEGEGPADGFEVTILPHNVDILDPSKGLNDPHFALAQRNVIWRQIRLTVQIHCIFAEIPTFDAGCVWRRTGRMMS